MNYVYRTTVLACLTALFLQASVQLLPAQTGTVQTLLTKEQQTALADTLSKVLTDGVMRMGRLRLNTVGVNDTEKKVFFRFNATLAEYPIRPENAQTVYHLAQEALPKAYRHYTLEITSDGLTLDELIPATYNPGYIPLTPQQLEANKAAYLKHVTPPKPEAQPQPTKKRRSKKRRGTPAQLVQMDQTEKRLAGINAAKWEAQQQMAQDDRQRERHTWPDLGPTPLITRTDKPFTITQGLQNRHLALWQSHGWYYEGKLARWEWQRARIFQTVEDIYTQSYVIPFLVPMLENAGAVVLLPRERDPQTHEVIVDNDGTISPYTGDVYSETNGAYAWGTPKENAIGFAHTQAIYTHYDNPFRMGTFRHVKTCSHGTTPSLAQWTPTLPETGSYAVYVSYKSLPLSARDAHYTVHHLGGEHHFTVNQQMGGGTWIYLGTFPFAQGQEGYVTLSNESAEKDALITADAVKFGGGMGNIGRFPQDSTQLAAYPGVPFEPQISRYPRFVEGARYWLQWAGFADSVYTFYEGKNDYTDDYTSRGRWVNTLAGGSSQYPTNPGLRIPIDLSFAFHTDAGTTLNDSIIGTLAIYTRDCEGTSLLPTGQSRRTSRDLTDLVQTQIVNDIRAQWTPDWTRRGLWNRSYAESRVPQVPSMLLELLSHQNLADMRYGLDPNFRFTVSRAIYKGMLRYLSAAHGVDYVVQPLPVGHFAVLFGTETTDSTYTAHLQWTPTVDDLEPSATADSYLLYTRQGYAPLSFDNGTVVPHPSCTLTLQRGVPYSFQVTAVNAGGESFPSETLSIYKAPVNQDKGNVLIVNGFTRISAPDSYASADTCYGGFLDASDHGVPYLQDISFIGSQYEFRRSIPWMDDDSPGFGASSAQYETTTTLPGNTFDFPAVHGQALAALGYSYASTSVGAFATETSTGPLPQEYPVVDVILGKQKQTVRGGVGTQDIYYAAFPADLQHVLTLYAQRGGNLLISGANVASDIWDGIQSDSLSQDFATQVLKYKWRSGQASRSGEVAPAPSPFPAFYNGKALTAPSFRFDTQLNPHVYPVESPDALEPACPEAFTIFRYFDNNLSAGVAFTDGTRSSVVLGFPLETLTSAPQRQEMMRQCLLFLNGKTDK